MHAARDRSGRHGMTTHARGDEAVPVVLEGGLAAPIELWSEVVAAIGGRATTIATERHGVGRSAPASSPRSLPALADELAASIRCRTSAPRVVVVAEGFGGLVGLEVARRHPGLVAGLVLVDALHPDALQRSARQRQGMARLESTILRTAWSATWTATTRRLVRRGRESVATRDDVARVLAGAPSTHRTAARELQAWKRSVRPPVDGLPPLRVPLAVLSSSRLLHGDPSQRPLQEALATCSTTSVARTLPGDAPLADPGAVAVIADAAVELATLAAASGRERAA